MRAAETGYLLSTHTAVLVANAEQIARRVPTTASERRGELPGGGAVACRARGLELPVRGTYVTSTCGPPLVGQRGQCCGRRLEVPAQRRPRCR